MIANVCVVVFVGFMAYWWSTQGLFSSLLHLLCVIVAGALAFAVWEPVTVGLLLGLTPSMAWGVGLLVPFVLLLLILRKLADRLILGNVFFIPIVNTVGGAALGLLSGILTAGITILGLSFLSIGPTLGGYQAYAVDNRGRVVESEQSLWLPVDRQAAGVITMLSGGAFTSGRPMREYRPQLPVLASLFRMHVDHNASLVASPEAVSVGDWYQAASPLSDFVDDQVLDAIAEIDGNARTVGHQLVSVETQWQQGAKGVYDEDGTLRIAPTQVRLIALPRNGQVGGGEGEVLFAPVGASSGTDNRQFIPFDSLSIFVHTSSQQERFTWSFLVPSEYQPTALLVRNLRLPLGDQSDQDADAIRLALGSLTPAAAQRQAQQQADAQVGARQGARTGSAAVGIELTSDLPMPVSRNLATGLRLDGDTVISGRSDVRAQEGQLSQALRINRIRTPDHRAMVRVELARDQAQSFFGAAYVAAATLATIELIDDQGNSWQPIAYVWRKQNNEQAISVDFNQPIRSARQLPVPDMGPNDSLYLYFLVNRGSTILNYQVGQTTQEVNLAVP